jgi:hypothetical protein
MVRLWEVATGAERLQIRVPFSSPEMNRAAARTEIHCVTFAAQGRSLILGKADGTVSLWHLPSAREARLLPGHKDVVAALAHSPDGKTFATGSWDTTVLLWDAATLLAQPRPEPVALSPHERDKLWAALAGADGAQAYRAIWALSAASADIVPFLKERLKPVPQAAAGRIARLIQDLADEQFAVRERATTELETYADAALDDLHKALAGNLPLEARRRIDRLLAKHGGTVPAPAVVQALRSVEVLEQLGTSAARQLLRELARGAPEAQLTRDASRALTRLTQRAADVP